MSQSISNTPVQQVGGLDLLGSTEPRYQVRGRRYTVGSVRPGVASYYDTPRVTLDKSVWDNCFSDSNSSFSKNPQPFNYPNNGNINSDRNNMNNKNSNLNVVDVNMQRRRGFSISGSNSKEMYSSKKHNNNNNNNSSNHNNHGHNGGFNSKRHSHNNKDFNHNSHKSITDVPSFLKAIQLQKYTQSLQDHGVTIEQLLTMTEQDLDRVGVTTIGARRRLLGALCKYNDYLANNWNGSHDDGMSLHSILNDGHSSSNNNNREFGGTHSGFRENKNSSSGRSHNNKGKNRSNSVSSNRLSSTAVMGLMVEDSFHKEDESFYCENTIDSRRRGQSAGYAIGTRFDDANGNNNGSAIVVHNDLPHIKYIHNDLPHIKYSNSSHNSPNLSSNINLSLSHRRHSTTELLNNNHSYHSSLHDNIHGAFFEDATTNTTPWALTANSGNGVNDTQAKKDRHLSLKTSHSTNEATLTGFSWNTTSTSKSPTLIGSPHISKQQGPKKQPVEQEQQPPLPSKQSQQVIGGDFLTDMMTSMSISNNSSSPIGDD
eukprot:Awhi_evm1s14211